MKEQYKVTYWSTIPVLSEFFHFREPLLNDRPEKLPCLASIGWNFRHKSFNDPEFPFSIG
jgi:hypothetical protein